MATLIHPSSAPAVPPELEVFYPPPTDATYQEINTECFTPVENPAAGGNITFEVEKSTEDFTCLFSSYLTFGAYIATPDGKRITAAHNVGPVNNFADSVWSRVSVELGNQMVAAGDHYPYRAILNKVWNYGYDAKASHLQTSLLAKDTAGEMDALPNAKTNTGLTERTKRMVAGKTAYFRTHLDSDIFHSPYLIPYQQKIRIVLERSRPQFCLMAGATQVAA